MMGVLRDHDEMYQDEYLRPLKIYQYKGVDKSPISYYILRPYWNAVTELFPLWVAYFEYLLRSPSNNVYEGLT